mmetsp:Transcript_4941/g.14558  ORF Transcript_4941/g.14558 Transcript_4941/m.14558 type:complete len:227 (-) Transcript_4941:97-777(-)
MWPVPSSAAAPKICRRAVRSSASALPFLSPTASYSSTTSLAVFTAVSRPKTEPSNSEIDNNTLASSSFHPAFWYAVRSSMRARSACLSSPISEKMTNFKYHAAARSLVDPDFSAWAMDRSATANALVQSLAPRCASAASCRARATTPSSPDGLRTFTASPAWSDASRSLPRDSSRPTTLWNAASTLHGSPEALASAISSRSNARTLSGEVSQLPWSCARSSRIAPF